MSSMEMLTQAQTTAFNESASCITYCVMLLRHCDLLRHAPVDTSFASGCCSKVVCRPCEDNLCHTLNEMLIVSSDV